MKSNKKYISKKINRLSNFHANIIDESQTDKIHLASLEILRNTGIRVDSPEVTKIFQNAGAKVTSQNEYAIVKFPSYMIENAIESAARPLVYYGRTKNKDFAAFPNHVGFSTFGECVKTIDLYSKEVRDTCKEDVANITKICDASDEIVVLERPCCSLDFPTETQPVHNFEAMLHNTSKAIFISAVNRENCVKMIEMAACAVGGIEQFRERPFLNLFVCPTSPLRIGKECGEVIIEAATQGAGIAIIPMALSGATAPITLAGTVAVFNAEILACILLAQLVKKGARCTYCSISTIMDLKYMIGAVGSPELGIMSAAAVKMAQRYNLPSWIGAGLSDSKLPDAQAGYEYAINATVGALSGANIVYGAGALESALMIDYAKLVMDCEAMKYIRKIMNGINVSEDELAIDIIHEVGPSGEYLNLAHTFEYMRNQSQVDVFSRKGRQAWESEGGKDSSEIAYEKAIGIINNHVVEPLPEGAPEKISQIILDFEMELNIKGR